ncbi:helix-turn-helix transcriptional regulator [Pseudobacillus sp. FSL P4-0506]|uniref:helix-turn-helix domain-containing protein n=1 Tax=Pseudobacillus sp. FSL P4-0506 TaxID=2921576 RepID=UPI0030F7977F
MENITPKILQQLREEKGWSKTEVARRLGIKTVSTYANWEYGIRQPDKDMLAKIAVLYDVTTDFLITGEQSISSYRPESMPQLTEKDERDIAKRMKKMREDLTEAKADGDGLNYMGEPMSPEAIESLLEALEHAERIATLANKKYIPKKHRDKD